MVSASPDNRIAPLAIDLCCGLGGWTDGLLAEGFDVIGFDIEQHAYGEHRYPGQLVLQDVTTLHGAQFRDAAVIVASPPCQEYAYMSYPWTRGQQIASALRGKGDFPAGFTGSRSIEELNALFDACFRIQREACEAASRHIPLVLENVRGAQKWVGRARWNYGSFYLWGDVPALMPRARARAQKPKPGGTAHGQDGCKVPGLDFSKPGSPGFNVTAAQRYREGTKQRGSGPEWFDQALDERRKEATALKTPGHLHRRDGHPHTRHLTNPAEHEGCKFTIPRPGQVSAASRDPVARSGGNSRKAASAIIAKIPLALSRHVARCFLPICKTGRDYANPMQADG